MKNKNQPQYRWIVLTLFIFVALLTQLLWLTFAPISSEAANLYNVTAFEISILSLVWPLVFVILAIPAGIIIDRKGFKTSVTIGAIFLAVFSIIRIFSIYLDYNFELLIIAQTGAAISQPFVFGSLTKLSISWFSEEEQGIATGLGSIGLFLGMMLALVITPMLYLSVGFTKMMIIYAYISILGAFLFIVLAKENHETKMIKDESDQFTIKDMWTLSKLRPFLILEFGFFVVVGGFTAILTWIEEILRSLHGLSIDEAGILGGLLIIGGIIGSIVIPAISDKTKKIKPYVLIDILIGSITLYLIAVVSGYFLLAIIFFIAGFFLMSALPLVLEISSRLCEKGMEGRSASLLWFFSQVGSVILILLVEPIYEIFSDYYYVILIIVVLWITAFLLFLSLKEVTKKTCK